MRDYKIAIIRILAMLSIVACHIFQAKNMSIAFWLNVGVQVFLFMSGFLYGKKKIEDTNLWIKRQFLKILIPYYIYIAFIIIIYIIYDKNIITLRNILSLIFGFQLFTKTKGLNHFWFIPIILICYLLTPLLQKLLKENPKMNIKKIIALVVFMFYIEIFPSQAETDTRLLNIICYVLGYLISYLSVDYKRENKILSTSIVILAIISNLTKVFLVPEEYNVIIRKIIRVLISHSHILLGSAIFIILYELLKNIEKALNPTTIKGVDVIDKYCFYVYITHHVFILGPLSMMNLTHNLALNITIIMICIIISSYILQKLTELVKKGVEKT